MKRSCSNQEAVARAARQGLLTVPAHAGLAAHVAECPVCGQVAQAATWMRELAMTAATPAAKSLVGPLPDAGAIWRRARWDEESSRSTSRDALLNGAQIMASASVMASFAWWVIGSWRPVQAAVELFLLNAYPQFAVYATALASLAPVALMTALLALSYPLLNVE